MNEKQGDPTEDIQEPQEKIKAPIFKQPVKTGPPPIRPRPPVQARPGVPPKRPNPLN